MRPFPTVLYDNEKGRQKLAYSPHNESIPFALAVYLVHYKKFESRFAWDWRSLQDCDIFNRQALQQTSFIFQGVVDIVWSLVHDRLKPAWLINSKSISDGCPEVLKSSSILRWLKIWFKRLQFGLGPNFRLTSELKKRKVVLQVRNFIATIWFVSKKIVCIFSFVIARLPKGRPVQTKFSRGEK